MYHLCFIVRSMATEAQDRVYLKSLRETVDAKQCVPLLCKVKGCKASCWAVGDTYVHKPAAELEDTVGFQNRSQLALHLRLAHGCPDVYKENVLCSTRSEV